MPGSPLKDIWSILPEAIVGGLDTPPGDVEDLRIRPNRPLQWIGGGREGLLGEPVPPALIRRALDALSGHSLYAWEEELRQGYFTLENGCRVGVCGRVTVENGRVTSMAHVGAVCVRIAREVFGAADALMSRLCEGGQPLSALVLGAPGSGKTTLLRDMARQLSSGGTHGGARKVAVNDERSELAACAAGVPSLNVGPRTDVLDGCPKRIGLPMLIRAMSPDVIITDELGHEEDARAVRDAVRCGVRVVASAHAAGYQEALLRSALREALEERLFDRIVVLGGRVGQVRAVLDAQGRQMGA